MEYKITGRITTDESGNNINFYENDIISDNENIYNNTSETTTGNYVSKTGDLMSGNLTLPELIFTGESVNQTQAFSDTHKSNLELITSNTSNISKVGENTKITGNLIFNDSSDLQTNAFTNDHKKALTEISYDNTLLKTTISNYTYINNASFGNINVSHLNATDGNLQTQIIAINNNINNIQNQLDDAVAEPTTAINFNNMTTSDSTIDTYNQADYNNFSFNECITFQGKTGYRRFRMGAIGDGANSTNHFCIGTDSGGGNDPNIIFSLSRLNAYFWGVCNPLVCVGTISIYAGSTPPTGYLLCEGQTLSKTTYADLWNVIGNNFLNGRIALSQSFYNPDLRGQFIRGVGTSSLYRDSGGVNFVSGSNLGEYQVQSVQDRTHNYEAPDSSDNVANSTVGNSTSVYDNNRASLFTTNTWGAQPNRAPIPDETRPANISMNYIIKY